MISIKINAEQAAILRIMIREALAEATSKDKLSQERDIDYIAALEDLLKKVRG